jgi:CHAT domain-containing protein/tetratricopeptide (TPR) repeat protein
VRALAVALLLAPSPQATSAVDCAGLSPFLGEAFVLFERDEVDAARSRFEQSLTRARECGDGWAEAEAHRGLGRTLYRKAQYPAAKTELGEARRLFAARADAAGVLGAARAAGHLGSVALATGDRAQARQLYTEALAAFDVPDARRDRAETLYNLTMASDELPVKLARLHEGLEAARVLGDPKLEGKYLHLWSDLEYGQGNFAVALDRLREATRRFEEIGAQRDLAYALNTLSRLERVHGQPRRALEVAAQALEIHERNGEVQGVLQSLVQVAEAHGTLGEYRPARDFLTRGMSVARQNGSRRMMDFMVGRLADAHLALGEAAEAAAVLSRALEESPTAEFASGWQRSLSRALLGLNRADEALAAAEKAVALARPTETAGELLPALHYRALARQRLGRNEEALADAREEVRVLEQLRERLVGSDLMKRGFADQYRAAYSLAIELLSERGRHAEAFEVAEQARARAFVDLLASRDWSGKPSQRQEVADLRGVEAQLRRGGVDPSAGGTLSAGLDPELSRLWKRWESADPELKSLLAVAPVSMADVTATARRLDSTLLSYFVATDALFVWVVDPSGRIEGTRVPVTAVRLVQLIRTARGLSPKTEPARRPPRSKTRTLPTLATRGGSLLVFSDDEQRAWSELFDLLIRPVRPRLPTRPGSRLTVIPHGPLFALPFAALRDSTGGRYLLEDHALHYAPSVAVLTFTARRTGRPVPGHRVLVADPRPTPVSPSGPALGPLPGAVREVAAVSRLLPRDGTVVLEGARASEDAVRRELAGAGLIHFATHAVVTDDDPLDSFLALGGRGKDAADDGRLSTRDIYGLDLDADLVVLSACRTGLGQLSADGIVGLTRAFFYAGTPSVMATLWDVPDDTTSRLIPGFYRRLAGGADKARALREAQLALLHALRAGKLQVPTPGGPVPLPESPRLWAGFVLVGEP